jgi:hypothetical protein
MSGVHVLCSSLQDLCAPNCLESLFDFDSAKTAHMPSRWASKTKTGQLHAQRSPLLQDPRAGPFNVANTPSHGLCCGIMPCSCLPPSGGASIMCSPSGASASGFSMHSVPRDGTSCMCPVAVGPNALSCAAAAFLALLAGSMLKVPLARAGAVPTAGSAPV